MSKKRECVGALIPGNCKCLFFLTMLIFSIILFLISCKGNNDSRQSGISVAEIKTSNIKCKPDTFTVGFYNLENCFDFEQDGSEYPEYIPGKSSWTREVQLLKVNMMAEVIAQLKADVIGVCELEDEDALEDLRQGLRRYHKNYEYFTIGKDSIRTVTCPALLSRFPVRQSLVHHVELDGSYKTRAILEADVEICNRIIKIFVNHWPSKLNPESQRLEAAKVLATRLQALPSGTEYILLGDFNSDYNEFQTFSSFKLNNTNGITGLNHIIKTILPDIPVRFVTQETIHKLDKGVHYDLWLELPESKRMSMMYKGNNQTPDHILVPSTLFDTEGFSYLDNTFSTFTWDSKLLKDGKPYRWQIKWVNKSKLHLGQGYSDHLPVVARFTNLPFTADTTRTVNESEGTPDQIVFNSKDTVSGSFVSSNEGWISCAEGIVLGRDSSATKKGTYCLKISGPAGKTNKTVAKTVLKNRQKRSVRFTIKGNGKFSFRISGEEKKWVYFNAPEFKTSKSARYTESNLTTWKQVILTHNIVGPDELEFEVRIGKESEFTLFLSDIH